MPAIAAVVAEDGRRSCGPQGDLAMRTNRRKFLGTVGTGAAALSLTNTAGEAAPKAQPRAATLRRDPDAPILQIGDSIAVADTSHGKIRGYILRDIHYFLGVPYGADTS